jgi:hypothetical protein
MILLLRGHIRNSFDNEELYNFIKILSSIVDIDIYIHTWNIVQNSISYRNIVTINKNIGENEIYTYFKDLRPLIKHIIIDDDTKIVLNGELTGNLCHTTLPRKGWKNMWYGIYRIMNYINDNVSHDEIVINTRFDILTNPYATKSNIIFNFIKENLDNKLLEHKCVFITNKLICGIDNIYMANVKNMYILTKRFNFELDSLEKKYPYEVHQEFMVPQEAQYL